MHSEGYGSWVCLSECLSVKPQECLFVLKILSHNSAGNGGPKVCRVFPETTPLQRSSTAPLKTICTDGHFSAESTHVHYRQYAEGSALLCIHYVKVQHWHHPLSCCTYAFLLIHLGTSVLPSVKTLTVNIFIA